MNLHKDITSYFAFSSLLMVLNPAIKNDHLPNDNIMPTSTKKAIINILPAIKTPHNKLYLTTWLYITYYKGFYIGSQLFYKYYSKFGFLFLYPSILVSTNGITLWMSIFLVFITSLSLLKLCNHLK